MPAQSIWTLLSWGPDGWSDDIAYGVIVTVLLALATLLHRSDDWLFHCARQAIRRVPLRLAANIYTTVFRGLPELVTLFLFFFGMPILLQHLIRYFRPDATIDVNSFVAGMIVLALIFSSYASEVFLSAFRAIPKGQYEGWLCHRSFLRADNAPGDPAAAAAHCLSRSGELLAQLVEGHLAGCRSSVLQRRCATPAWPLA